LTAGGNVTAVQPRRPSVVADNVYTFVAVQPGDELVVGDPAAPTSPPPTFAASVIVPDPLGTTADYVAVTTRCGGGGVVRGVGPQTAPITISCSPVDLYVEAIDTTVSLTETVQSFLIRNVTVTPGQTIDLSSGMFKAFADHTLTLTSFPQNLTNGTFDAMPLVGGFELDQYLSQVDLSNSGTSTNPLRLADLSGIDLALLLELYDGPDSATAIMRVAPYPGDVTMDIAALRVPAVNNGALDIANHRVTWTEIGTQPADVSKVTISVRRPGPEGLIRHIAGPHTAGSLVFPVLGSALASFNIVPADAADAQIELVEIARFSDGWNAHRGNVFRNLSSFHYRSLFSTGGVMSHSSTPGSLAWNPTRVHAAPRRGLGGVGTVRALTARD
jgi:hypothetical protein